MTTKHHSTVDYCYCPPGKQCDGKPTNAPTEQPTLAPTESWGDVEFVGWTPGTNIAICSGDCDSDDECANSEYGVKCIHETQHNGVVPGCEGMTHKYNNRVDYCYCPQGETCSPPGFLNAGPYTAANYECHHDNCQNWNCAQWCKCYTNKAAMSGLYKDAGCGEDDGDECKC